MSDPPKEWWLTTRYWCPQCGKRYAVADWKLDPKCRQCGTDLRADDEPVKSTPKAGS